MTTSASTQSGTVSEQDLCRHLINKAADLNEAFPIAVGQMAKIAGVNPHVARSAARFGVLPTVVSKLGGGRIRKVHAEAAAKWLLQLDGGKLAPVYADEISKSVSTNN